MATTEPLKPGDACPACGGDFKPAPVPSAAQRKAFEDRESRMPYPTGFDTASEDQRQELGALHRCRECKYETRFPFEGQEDGGKKGKKK